MLSLVLMCLLMENQDGLRKSRLDSTRGTWHILYKNDALVLTGVAQWIECWPANQRVTGSIPSQGTCLGCRPDPQLGVYKRQAHIAVSLPLFTFP